MTSRRTQRVSEQIHQELASLLLVSAKDPRLNLVTITGVDVSSDLRLARVHIITATGRLTNADALASLKRALPFLRRELGQRLRLRIVPELAFFLDDSLDQGRRIETLLASLTPLKPSPLPELDTARAHQDDADDADEDGGVDLDDESDVADVRDDIEDPVADAAEDAAAPLQEPNALDVP